MNKELGRKVLHQVEAHPELFDMDSWVNECGTTCCIGGHALLKSGKYELCEKECDGGGTYRWFRDKETQQLVGSVSDIARELLDLSDKEFYADDEDAGLFYADNQQAIERLRELVEG